MKKGLIAAAAMLSGALGMANAEYAVIITNLGARSLSTSDSSSAGSNPDMAGPRSGSGKGPRPPLSSGPGPLSGPGPSNPATQEKRPVDDPNAILITAIVEVDPPNPVGFKNLMPTFESFSAELPIKHRWGSSSLASSNGFPKSDKLEIGASFRLNAGQTQGMLASVHRRYLARHAEIFKGPKPTAEKVIELANWALEHGALDKVSELMDELKDREKNDPAVVAYLDVKARLKENLASPSEDKLSKLVGTYDNKKTAHFIVFYKPVEKDEHDIKSKLDKLEDTYRAYYYWFALRGQKLAMPSQQLTIVLAADEGDFTKLMRTLNAGPQVADGFFCRRDNISVVSTQPLDQGYFQLTKKSDALFSNGFKKSDLLLGKKIGAGIPAGTDQITAANARMSALMLKAMENDSELASITHAVARQLTYLSGRLSKNVVAPEWVQFGAASFFETTSGSPWTTYGAPSGPYWMTFNEMKDQKKEVRLEKTPVETMQKVVTNAYFLDQGLTPTEKEAFKRRARATSWSLTYYLMKNHLVELDAFYKELSNQPRDVELDGSVVWNCFTKALAPTEAKQKELADRWYNFMKGQIPESKEILELVEQLKDKVRKPPVPESTPAGGGGKPGTGSG